MQQFHKFLLDVYVSLNMFRVPPRPSYGAYNCINSLWVLPLERDGSSAVGRGPARPRLTTLLPPRSNGKTRGC